MITSFPKIFHIGTDFIRDLFNGPVEITEKIDGSQFVFGKIKGELLMRSRGTMIHDYHARAETDLFYPVIQHVLSMEEVLPDNTVFYGETLARPKHNTLAYERVPTNHFMLFGVSTEGHVFVQEHKALQWYADFLHVEVVPLLYHGEITDVNQINEFMEKPSVLGGCNAEGVVVKNYGQPFLLGGQPIPVMAGKYVTEAFKEVHRTSWGKENTAGGKWQVFKESFCTEARWQKSVQHLAEAGELENGPRDIGKLIPAVKDDITEEEKENIKEFLWKEFGQEVLRSAVKGLPEWYKQRLMESAFERTKEKLGKALEKLKDA